MKLYNQDCMIAMKQMEDNSVDSIVTDPPYGISFMSKKWDYDVPKVEVWKEALRVLKAGGHILVACGTRTQHRMCVNIEDAGFEIRDIVAWVYGSGFPKSLNIGKAVDKLQGNEREVVGQSRNGANSLMGGLSGTETTTIQDITKGNSKYEGWGTALKPAMELWTLARKPLSEKTVAENVLKWGTGGINIDGCRVEVAEGEKIKSEGHIRKVNVVGDNRTSVGAGQFGEGAFVAGADLTQGRFPANLIHDGSDEVVGLFPDSNSRFFYCAKASKSERNAGLDGFEEKSTGHGNLQNSKGMERFDTYNKNNHPTVKPVKLMQYLIRLVTPKGGVVLDMFMGSGTTGIACKKENFNFVGIELDKDYFKIAKARIEKLEFQHDLF